MEMHGLAEALSGLRQFSQRVRRKHTAIAMNSAGGLLRDEAKRHAPRETGLMRRTLTVRGGTNRRGNAYAVVGAKRKFVAWVEPGKRKLRVVPKKVLNLLPPSNKVKKRKPSRYMHLVHGGTRRHEIRARNAPFLTDGRGSVFGVSVRVGARPKPFLEVAVRSKGGIAIQRAIRKVQEGIEQERRKALSKAKRK